MVAVTVLELLAEAQEGDGRPGLTLGGLTVTALNRAVTERASLIVTTQLPVPEHPAPDQPLKAEPTAARAVSVTARPSTYGSLQSLPHEIPAGSELTVPLPLPA